MEEERYDRADNRMNSDDGGLARHEVKCGQEIDWEKGNIIGKEDGYRENIWKGLNAYEERIKG